MSTDDYTVSEYYQVLDMVVSDPVLDIMISKTTNLDYIKDSFEKLIVQTQF